MLLGAAAVCGVAERDRAAPPVRGFICQTGNMATPLQITAVSPDPALFDLPWQIPLEEWPEDILAAFPRGISRHVVRFVRVSGRVLAIKEIGETVAYREYALLRDLKRLELPSVTPVGVITGRQDPQGRPLDSVLITKHLKFSLPYRLLFSRHLAPNMATQDRKSTRLNSSHVAISYAV